MEASDDITANSHIGFLKTWNQKIAETIEISITETNELITSVGYTEVDLSIPKHLIELYTRAKENLDRSIKRQEILKQPRS